MGDLGKPSMRGLVSGVTYENDIGCGLGVNLYLKPYVFDALIAAGNSFLDTQAMSVTLDKLLNAAAAFRPDPKSSSVGG